MISKVQMLENEKNNRLLIRVYETDGNKNKVIVKFYKTVLFCFFILLNILEVPINFSSK